MGEVQIIQHVKSLAREMTLNALATLEEIACDPSMPPGARVRAAEVLLNRGWGTAKAEESPETLATSLSDDALVARVTAAVQRSGSPRPLALSAGEVEALEPTEDDLGVGEP